eukprot:m.116612 g.116612  ORF g.116612 m.116612 type:complete len:461 (-) comp16382_c0_seq6:76-1458(-)
MAARLVRLGRVALSRRVMKAVRPTGLCASASFWSRFSVAHVAARRHHSTGSLGGGGGFGVGGGGALVSSMDALESATLESQDADRVAVLLGASGTVHELLLAKLRHHCPCSECQEPFSGQRQVGAQVRCFEASTISDAAGGNGIEVVWADGHFSHFSADWLTRLTVDRTDLELQDPPVCNALQKSDFADIVGSDAGLFRWLAQMHRDGAALVVGVPEQHNSVCQLARRISHVQPTIYGDVFDVVSTSKPVNIAYTGHGLVLHQDLAYYESPPGLQFLHCLRFDNNVKGGESTLVDAFHAARRLEQADPAAFAALCHIPATFEKDHRDREIPVALTCRRPHITTNARGQVTSVTWAPPFEGPLQSLDIEQEQLYYAAYAKLEEILDSTPQHRLRLKQGEMLTFNNRRMLHGRTAFYSDVHGARHLQGCYVNIDEFHSRLRTLRDKFDPEAPLYHVGNQNLL